MRLVRALTAIMEPATLQLNVLVTGERALEHAPPVLEFAALVCSVTIASIFNDFLLDTKVIFDLIH